LKLPGLLIIDTPGHESFSNLRDRGSSLCDIAILVIDIMHGLEPQTIESLNLLKKKKTPFVVALNKVDRLYEWKANRHKDIREVLEMQQHNTMMEFEKRKDEALLALAEQGLNAALWDQNPDPEEYINVVPTSAISGDGMGNLMAMLVTMSETYLAKRLSFSDELQATVLEVKAIGGFGTTIDVVLINGTLKFGQTIVIAGTDGPIVTTVKALLTPKKMQDLRVKVQYTDHKVLPAAQGVKIAAKELEKAIAGLNMRVALHPDEIEICKEECQRDLSSALNAIKLKERGVYVQASTLGSLEALLEFLKTSKIPYAGVRIGPVVRRDVMKACAMLEHEEKYAVILAFDVKVERDAQEFADKEGVRIFQADIIYHLFDRFTEYQDELKRAKKEEFRSIAVFPCKLRVMPENVFMSRDPIVCGVHVDAGIIKPGTPICVPSKEFINIGICTSLQHNNKDVDTATKGMEVCIKIEPVPGEAPKMFGRHFTEEDLLISKISRESIDACKDYFRDELQKSDWQLMVELKKLFEIL
jgi:translation initiation factor 5B